MLTDEQIATIHRLHFVENWTVRKIASHLHIGRRTITKYLANPAPVAVQRSRSSKLDPFKPMIQDWLQQDTKKRRAYVRMEPGAGERFEIDWGHFGSLVYDGAPRKLYAFCLVECHSRKLYVEFTHSQTFETLVRCHIHAFHAMGGVAQELWYD